MKFVKKTSLAVLFVFVTALLQAAVTIRSVSDQSATVTVEGTVSAVSSGQNLEEGLLVTNSATVKLILENNSVLILKPNSAIRVDQLSGPNPVLVLLRGEISGIMTGSLQVTTDVGVANFADGAFAVSTDGVNITVDNGGAVASVTPAGVPAPTPVNPGQRVVSTGDGIVSVVGLTPGEIALLQGSSPTQIVSTPEAIIIPDFENILVDAEIASNPG